MHYIHLDSHFLIYHCFFISWYMHRTYIHSEKNPNTSIKIQKTITKSDDLILNTLLLVQNIYNEIFALFVHSVLTKRYHIKSFQEFLCNLINQMEVSNSCGPKTFILRLNHALSLNFF